MKVKIQGRKRRVVVVNTHSELPVGLISSNLKPTDGRNIQQKKNKKKEKWLEI